MTGTPPFDEQLSGQPPTLYERHVYFRQLAQILLNSGVEGDEVGRIVAELDLHVGMTGTDPVEELGPVTELARSLRKSSGAAHLGRTLTRAAVTGAAVGLAYATYSFLTAPDLHPDSEAVQLDLVGFCPLVMVGGRLARGLGASSRRGRWTSVRPSWRAFALYFLTMVPVVFLLGDLRWAISRPMAVALLVGSVAVAAVSGLWSMWRWRVRVPGRPSHLRGLGWG